MRDGDKSDRAELISRLRRRADNYEHDRGGMYSSDDAFIDREAALMLEQSAPSAATAGESADHIDELERENLQLQHDLERATANHAADLSARSAVVPTTERQADIEWLRKFINCAAFAPPSSEIEKAQDALTRILAVSHESAEAPISDQVVEADVVFCGKCGSRR